MGFGADTGNCTFVSYCKAFDRIAVARTAFAAERKGFVRKPAENRIVAEYMSVGRKAVAAYRAGYTGLDRKGSYYMAIPEAWKTLLQRKPLVNIVNPKKELLFPIDDGSRKQMASRMPN